MSYKTMKIAIVNQRYGLEVNGGSEYYTRLIAEKLSLQYDVEVLTTCAIDYSDWANYYTEGVEIINNVKVRRFKVKKKREQKKFDKLTAKVLNDRLRTEKMEYEWIEKQGPYCPECIEYIEKHSNEYDVFIFVTYLYYLTAMGLPKVAEKSILIPTAHDEPFLKFKAYQKVFESPRGHVFLTSEERELVQAKFYTEHIKCCEAAVGVDVPSVSPQRFIDKYEIANPYIIYVGRIDEGKNCHVLFEHFLRWKSENQDNPIKLVLMGKSVIDVPDTPDIINLGFVSDEDKYNGIAAAKLLVLPSQYESLSISVLEAMSLGIPVLVNGQCEVLKAHCSKSNAGLYYDDYAEFAETLNYVLQRENVRQIMAENGKQYVNANYKWDVICDRLAEMIEYVANVPEVHTVQKNEKKIGFVIPWFGMHISGGAESELRDLALHLKDTELNIEILTTCVKDANSDWSVNYHLEGLDYEAGIPVRRFKVDKRKVQIFDSINWKLMQGEKISRREQEIFIKEMLNSTAMYRYMKNHEEDYAQFVFIPYLFGTTYNGVKLDPSKAILIPCFHDEGYFHMDIFKDMYAKVAGVIYNAMPEKELAETHYDMSGAKQFVMGIGMDTDITGDEERFRKKYQIDKPFILYAGRKDVGKNVDLLIKYFCYYKKEFQDDLQLVLIGGGSLEIPMGFEADIIDLGFVSVQDKYDAYSAAEMLCQPSVHESFSLVIMESWLCGTPVLVHEDCAVTTEFAKAANGGLYFKNCREFAACVHYMLLHQDVAKQMGKSGKKYVIYHFSWDSIVQKYITYFRELKCVE